HLVIDGSTLTVQPGDGLVLNGNWTEQSGGVFSPAVGSTVAFTGTSVISMLPGSSFYHLLVDGAVDVKDATDVTIRGNLTLNSGVFTVTNSTVSVAGHIPTGGGSLGHGANSTYVFNGAANQTIACPDFRNIVSQNNGNTVYFPDLSNVYGDFTLMGGGMADFNNRNVSFYGSFERYGTPVNLATATFVGGSNAQFNCNDPFLSDLVVAKNSGAALSAGDGMNLDGDFLVQGGTFVPGAYVHSLAGNFIVTGGFLETDEGKFVFDGSGDQALSWTGGNLVLCDVDVNGGASVTQTGGGLLISTLTVNAGGFYNGSNQGTRIDGGINNSGNLIGLIATFESSNTKVINSTTTPFSLTAVQVQEGVLQSNVALTVPGGFGVSAGSTFTAVNSTFVHTLTGLSNSGKFSVTGGTVTFNGAGTNDVFAGDNTFSHLLLNMGAGGLLQVLSGSLNVDGNFTLAGGTFTLNDATHTFAGNFTQMLGTTLTANGSTIKFDGSETKSFSAMGPFYNVVVANTGGDLALEGDVDINGSLIIESPSGSIDWSDAGRTVRLAGDFIDNNNFSQAVDSKLIMDGDACQHVGGSSTNMLVNFEINSSSTVEILTAKTFENVAILGGTMTLAVSNINVRGDWNHTGGGFLPNGSTVTFTGGVPMNGQSRTVQSVSGSAFNHFSVNATTAIAITSDLGVTGNFTLLGGTVTLDGYGLEVGGDWTESAAVRFRSAGGTVTFRGGGAQSVTQSPSSAFGTLEHANNSNLVANSDLNIGGNFYPNTGSFDTNGFEVRLKGDFLTPSGTFNPSGTWVFQGSGAQNVAQDVFDNVDIQTGGTLVFTNPNGLKTNDAGGTGHLTIGPAATVGFGGNDLEVAGNMLSSGTISGVGLTTFSGAANQSVWLTPSSSLGYTYVNKTGGLLTATTGLTFLDSLNIVNGGFDLGLGTHEVYGFGYIGSGGPSTLNVSSAAVFFHENVSVTNGSTLILPDSVSGGKLALASGKTLQVASGEFVSQSVYNMVGSTQSGVYVNFVVQSGSTINVSGMTLGQLGDNGLEIQSGAKVAELNNVNYREFKPGSKGLYLNCELVSPATFTAHDFDSSITTNVYLADNIFPAYIYMQGATGVSSGPAREYDPHNRVFWGVPTEPSAPAALAASATSLQWSWTNNSQDFEGTKISSMSSGENYLLSAGTSTTSQYEYILSTNTLYTRYIYAYSPIGESLRVSTQAYTWAALPGGSASTFTAVGATILTVNWTDGGNPAGTTYIADISTGPFPNSYADNKSSTTLNTYAVFSGLDPITVYYAQVRAVNHGGVETGELPLGSTQTENAVIWTGASSTSSLASDVDNWLSNARPVNDVRVIFNAPGSVQANCQWDLPEVSIMELRLEGTFNGTVTLTSSMTATGDVVLDAGTFDSNNRNMSVGGDWGVNGALYNSGGGGAILFNGVSSQTADLDYPLPIVRSENAAGLTLGSSAGTMQVGGLGVEPGAQLALASGKTLLISGNFSSSGTFNNNGSTVSFGGTGSVWAVAGTTFACVSVNAGTLSAANALDVNGHLRISGGVFNAGAFNHALAGDLIQTGGTFDPQTSTFTFDAPAGDQNIVSLPGGTSFYHLVIDRPSAFQYVNGSTVSVLGDLTVASGLVSVDELRLKGDFNWYSDSGSGYLVGSRVVFDGGAPQTFRTTYSGSVGAGDLWEFANTSPSGVTFDLSGGTVPYFKDITIAAGTKVTVAAGEIVLGGNATSRWANYGTFDGSGSTVSFTSPGTVELLAGAQFAHVKLETQSNVLASTAMAVSGNFTVLNGTFTAGDHVHSITGHLNLGGRFDLGESTLTVTGNTTVSAAGELNLSSGVGNFTGPLTVSGVLRLPAASPAAVLKPVGGVTLASGAKFEAASVGSSTPTVTAGSAYSFVVSGATVDVNGLILKNVSNAGLTLSADTRVDSFSNVRFDAPAGTTALLLQHASGTFNFTNLWFNDPNIAANISAPNHVGTNGSSITVSGYGVQAGPLFENDPNNVIHWSNFDNVGPTSSVTYPVNGGYVTALSALTGTAADTPETGSGFSKVEMALRRLSDGYWWNGSTDFDQGVPYFALTSAQDGAFDSNSEIWTYPMPTLSAGASYYAVSRASDTWRAESPLSAGVTFYFDDGAPQTGLLRPDGAYQGSALTTLSGTASDSGFGLNTVQVRVRRLAGLNPYWNAALQNFDDALNADSAWFSASSTGAWETWQSTQSLVFLVTGTTYTVEAKSRDLAGNWDAITSTGTFMYDATPAFSVLLLPGNDTRWRALPVVSGTAADLHSPLSGVGVQ
ncbi:MAG TPA: fibronectin type III domain-containing protein, partial [Elusimicrobiota bacterium]|nr:fibronectin type III domain-containing protein [Elusimicrobiota bacterium]